jgi:hypothetical protein
MTFPPFTQLLNFFQLVSLAAGLPLQWPDDVRTMLEWMNTIASAGTTLLIPDCELTHISTAGAFYMKQIAFTFLVPGVVCMCSFVWFVIWSTCARQAGMRRIDVKNNLIISIVLILFLCYPLITRMCLSMLKCPDVGGTIYLMADLQEPCFVGRHTANFVLLTIPQFFAYVVGLPTIALAIIMRNKHLHDDPQFELRYGLLYLGYSRQRRWWEVSAFASFLPARRSNILFANHTLFIA